MTNHTPHDTTEIPVYPVGLYVGGSDATEVAVLVVSWKTASGTDKSETLYVPVGVTIPVEGFYRIKATGTTLTTNGHVAYYYGAVQKR
jgi:hypothetical protein